jgi:hypothetical protein
MTTQNEEHRKQDEQQRENGGPLPAPEEVFAEPGPTDEPATEEAARKPCTWIFVLTFVLMISIGVLAAYLFFMM